MKVLFIGGNRHHQHGLYAIGDRARNRYHALKSRPRSLEVPSEVKTPTANYEDTAEPSRALAGTCFDAVVDWIAFRPADIERDITLLRGSTRQFVFISSASVYQKPVSHHLITESTPLANPYWE